MITRRCTASCDSCCFECSPRIDEELDVEVLRRFLQTTIDDKGLSLVSFTGGEPFLRFSDLCDLISFVTKELNKQVSVVTNGFWADSPQRAVELATAVKALGLDRISFSCDHYHSRYVPISYVKNALDACHEAGIAIAMCSIVRNGETIEDIVADLGESLFRTMYEIDYCVPSGRAKKIFPESAYRRSCDPANMRCVYDGSLSIGSNGKIYPCCSQTILDSCIDIGDYRHDTYSGIVDKVENNGLLHLIKYVGFKPFYDYATNVLKMNLPKKFVRPCELCQTLFSNETQLEAFTPLVDEEIGKLFERGEAKMIGE